MSITTMLISLKGVLLVDPQVKEGFPLWSGPRPFENSRSMHSTISAGPPRSSCFEDVIFWTQNLTSEEISLLPRDPRLFSKRILCMICAEWLTLVTYITTRLTQIDWELEHPGFRRDPLGLDASLQKLHPWRRWLPIYHAMITETIEKVFEHHSKRTAEEDGLADLLVTSRSYLHKSRTCNSVQNRL